MRPNCERFDCFPIQVSSFFRFVCRHTEVSTPFFNDFDALSNPLFLTSFILYIQAGQVSVYSFDFIQVIFLRLSQNGGVPSDSLCHKIAR